MISGFVLSILMTSHIMADTMLLPLYDGKILSIDDKSKTAKTGVLIRPSSDFSVRSCTDGKVQSVWQTRSGWCSMINSNDTLFTYAQMDTVLVNPGWLISKGELIGERKQIMNDYNSIIFIVLKGNRELDPENFIIYSK